jgi:hypothetical protein
MKTILWKELRENLKWALLGMLGLAAAMAWALSESDGRNDYYEVRLSLLSRPFQMATMLGCPLVAGLLGLMQILPERRRDQWALLIHRPMTRTHIFWGKVIAGVGLYLLATLVPLAGAAFWVLIPGHVAVPFDWRMTQPGLADILMGVAYYALGLLIGLRQARWYGTRWVAASVAFLGSLLASHCPTLLWASVIAVWAIGVLGSTAWGSFLTAGAYEGQPASARFTLGFCLATGIGFVVAFAVAVLISTVFPEPDRKMYYYEIDHQGRVLKVTQSDMLVTAVTDLRGAPIADYHLPMAVGTFNPYSLRMDPIAQRYFVPSSFRDGSRLFTPAFPQSLYGNWGMEQCYYIRSQRLIQVFDKHTRQLTGYYGPEGFTPAGGSLPKPFPEDAADSPTYGPCVIAFPHALYQADLARHTLEACWRPPAGEAIRATGCFRDEAPVNSPVPTYDVVLTQQRVVVLNADHQVRLEFPLPRDLERWGSVSMGRLPDRYVLWQKPLWRPRIEHLPDVVTYVTLQGKPLETRELPSMSSADVTRSRAEQVLLRIGPAFVPSSLIGVVVAGSAWWAWITDTAWSPPPLNAEARRDLIVLGIGAIASVLGMAWLIGRYAPTRRQRVLWLLNALLLGPLVFPTLWSLRGLPVREKCASCGRKRIVQRETCEHCGAPWPKPPTDGTEIFELAKAEPGA